MSFITIDDQQAKVLLESTGEVEIRDKQGNCLGLVTRSFNGEEIAEARRRLASGGPWYSTRQVLDHLRSLESP
jgi:hypothetical protein